MSKLTIIKLIIGAGLIIIFFLTTRENKQGNPDVEVTIAHLGLGPEMLSAFQLTSNEYSRLHPNISIKHINIPNNVYPLWIKIQLMSQAPPDIMNISNGLNESQIAENLIRLDEYVQKPNPYNAGTDLENQPWRLTFTDGLLSSTTLIENLNSIYAVGTSADTMRLIYNKNLLHEVFGDKNPPNNFAEFLELKGALEKYNEFADNPVFLLSAGIENVEWMLGEYIVNQTQKLLLDLDWNNDLNHTIPDSIVSYLKGEWSIDSPEIQNALEMLRVVSNSFQPGFIQMKQEDAIYLFLKGKSMMIVTGSWELPFIEQNSDFDLGVSRIPVAESENPRYGEYTLGPRSFRTLPTLFPLGVSSRSKNIDEALDYLMYLTSKPVNKKFSHIANRIPVIRGLKPKESLMGFVDSDELVGYTSGLWMIRLGPESEYRFTQALAALVNSAGTTQDFTELIRNRYIKALEIDLRAIIQNTRKSMIAQEMSLAENLNDSNETSTRVYENIEIQNSAEGNFLRYSSIIE